jgi:hypothetical protein
VIRVGERPVFASLAWTVGRTFGQSASLPLITS